LLHFANSQQWTRVREHLDHAAKLAAGKPGLRWLRDGVLYVSRRHEELKKRILEESARLAQAPPAPSPGDDLFLVNWLHSHGANLLPPREWLTLLDALRPVYERQPKHTQALKQWLQYRGNGLANAGPGDEARRVYARLAAEFPRDYGLQQQYANALFQAGDYDAAYAWLTKGLVKESRWRP